MYHELLKLLAPESVSINEPMRKHTTFKIGGPVDVLVSPCSLAELKMTLGFCQKHTLPMLVFGLGSNILVTDKGIRGIAIQIGDNLKEVRVEGEEVYAQAGIGLAELAQKVAACSLSGLEFAQGIPGSLGGAIAMNAGAYDGEMQTVVKRVEAISLAGEERIFHPNDIDFGYRSSIFQHNGYIIIAAHLQLNKGQKESILARMGEFARRRQEKQPLEYPSAGSVFKRPPGFYVGPMIEDLGLKGYRIGGAEVSAKHAGFIVNTDNATAADVLELIAVIQKAARDRFEVDLQPEIRVIGEL